MLHKSALSQFLKILNSPETIYYEYNEKSVSEKSLDLYKSSSLICPEQYCANIILLYAAQLNTFRMLLNKEFFTFMLYCKEHCTSFLIINFKGKILLSYIFTMLTY